MKIATAQDMRRIDEMAVRDYAIPISRLMESAGAAVVSALEKAFKPLFRKSVLVLCGKGHNGGDGLVIARLLKKKKIRVMAIMAAKQEECSEETRTQYQKAKAAKVPVLEMKLEEDLARAREWIGKCDILTDALLGTGLSRPVEGISLDLIRLAKTSGKPVLAVDIPSGLSADTGAVLGEALPAQLTVTFGLPKTGFYTPLGASLAGALQIADIGFPDELLNAPFLEQELTDWDTVRSALPLYDDFIHKGTRGRLLVVAGSTGLTGAATLCALAAQRIGTGLVTVACPKSLNVILETKLTEPMTAPVAEIEGGFLSPAAEGRILELAENADAVVIGPGLGQNEETGKLLSGLLTKITSPMVVDADGLNLLGGQMEFFRKAKAPILITPHPGEAARLLKISVSAVEEDRVRVAKQIAQSYNATAVLKGRHTVIANPESLTRINPTGNRSLATAGTGDVLSGILGGLLAQGLAPFEAATAGVYIHGLAGSMGSRRLGLDGLLAGDLLPLLPRILRRLRENRRESL